MHGAFIQIIVSSVHNNHNFFKESFVKLQKSSLGHGVSMMSQMNKGQGSSGSSARTSIRLNLDMQQGHGNDVSWSPMRSHKVISPSFCLHITTEFDCFNLLLNFAEIS